MSTFGERFLVMTAFKFEDIGPEVVKHYERLHQTKRGITQRSKVRARKAMVADYEKIHRLEYKR